MPPTPDADALAGLPPLREVIRRHGLGARKSLGQHFLLDLNLTRRIARAAGDIEGRTVLEVGPGPGGLTRALLEAGAHVLAVERDRRCLAALAELAEACPGRLILVEADALEFDEAAALSSPAPVVANLPYNIATPLLMKWLERPGLFERLTLMFQKEVAERLAAAPGSKAYGRLSAMVQWRAEVAPLFEISAQAFTPPPKVRSMVVQVTPRTVPLAPADAATLGRVLAAAFGQRRKMLRASLRGLGVPPEPLLAAAGVAPTARAEELDVAAFCRLANALDGADPTTGRRADA
jgi:16S rRNA (adenine1518-N6/adenine1519-N6)-dimethyltransferase